MEEKKPSKNIFSAFGIVATTLGFIVDSITIVTILITLKLPEASTASVPIFITPSLALGIWVIAFFVYLALIHNYWERNQKSKNFNVSFFAFVKNDLVIKFRSPFMLLPGVILFVLLLGILFIGFSVAVAIILTTLVMVSPIILMAYDDTTQGTMERNKGKIDRKWGNIEKRIEIELQRNHWVSCEDLKDLADLLEISTKGLSYALAKYANKHPDTTKYAYVYSTETNYPVSGSNLVLINIRSLPAKDYYAMSK